MAHAYVKVYRGLMDEFNSIAGWSYSATSWDSRSPDASPRSLSAGSGRIASEDDFADRLARQLSTSKIEPYHPRYGRPWHYQSGKGSNRVRGHILVDEVPYNRIRR